MRRSLPRSKEVLRPVVSDGLPRKRLANFRQGIVPVRTSTPVVSADEGGGTQSERL